MILKSFLLGNPVSLCVKIINSVVVVGLYYGFLTTFSIGPSYLFLLRARVMEEKEGTEKLVSATAGFILGQLMMFLSIYYAPLHLALDRPHTITVLVLPYLLFHYFCHKEIQFFEYTNRNRNSIRKFSIRRVFLNNLIFQLFNQLLLPSSTLARLVNVSMFRCNNKMLFVTSSFVGWLIGHIFFMKWVGLILFWIRKMMNSIKPKIMNSIRSKKDIRLFFYKYYAYKLFIFSKNELFFMILLITNIYYLGRIPTPALTRGLPESALIEEWERGKNEKGQKFLFWFEHHLVTILFDYKLWNRPLRYIKNDNFEKPVMDEMSQYFFRICPGYGKQIISLTHPPSLSTFWKMMQRKLEHWFSKRKRKQPRGLSIDLVSINRKKRGNARLELIDRIRALAKGALVLDVLEKRTRVCDEDENKEKEDENKEKEDENKEKEDENKEKYLPKVLDPFLCGPYRQKRKGHTFRHSQKEWFLNRILCGTLVIDLPGLLEPKSKDRVLEAFKKPEVSRKVKAELLNIRAFQMVSNYIMIPKVNDPRARDPEILKEFLDPLDPEILKEFRENWEIGKETIRTKVPRWSHYLNTDLQEEETEIADEPTENFYPVLLREYNRLLVYSEDDENIGTNASIGIGGQLEEQDNEVAMLQYKTEETDDLRGLIKGSTTAQRRKAVFLSPYQINIQSPLFLDRTDRKFFLFFDISKIIDTYKKVKKIFSNGAGKGPEFEVSTSDFKREKNKELQELVKQYLSSSSRKNEKRSRKAIKKKWKEILSIEKLKEESIEKLKKESIEKLKKESEKTGKKKEQKSEKFDEFLELGLWDVVLAVQGSRGLALVAQSIFRKYILLPSIVIAKNLVRMLLLQTPEWSADWKDWKKEGHIKCTYSGVELSDTEFPSNWLTEGIQIKVVFPFYPKPWRRSKLRSRHRDPMKEKKRNADWENKRKGKKKHSFYLTAWGGATDRPFGRPQKIPSFFQPIWKELKKRIRKEENKPFSFSVLIRALISSLIKRFPFLWTILGILEDKTRWIQNQKITPFIKEKIKEFAKKNSIFRKPNREIKRRVSQSQLQMPQKNLTRMVSTRRSRGGVKVLKRTVPRRNRYNNRMTFRFNPPATATNLTHSQIQMRILDIEKSRILGEIRKLEEKILDLTPDENISETGLDNISETGLDAEKWEIWLWLYISEVWLFFGDMLRIIGALLIRKLHLIICLFIERIYMDIFLCTINISFLCTINICRIHAQPFFESKRKMINKYIENIEKRIDETNQKNAIDFDFISTLKESHSTNSNSSNDNEKSQTSWDLSSLSQAYVFYNLSQTQVINKYHLRSVLQDRGAHLFFKDRIKDFLRTLGILDAKSSPKRLPNSGMNQWKNWLRGHYRYNFSQTRGSELVPEKRRDKVSKRHTSQNKESKKDSYEKDQPIHCEKQKNSVRDSLLSQEKWKKNYRYGLLSHKYIHYADKADKKDSYTFIDIEDALEKESITIIDMFAENAGRKYADWRAWGNLLGFYEEVRRKKKKKNIDSETPTNRDTRTDINEKRNPSNPKSISDRIGDLSRSRRKRRRMSMERKLLLFNYVNYEGISENQKGKEEPGQKNLGSDPQNQQKDLEKDSAESDINKKRGKQFKKKKKKKKNMNQAELKLFLRKHLLSQLYLNPFLDRPMMTSVRAYCFLLKTLNDSRDIAIYFVRTGDIRLGIMEELQHSMDPSLNVPELIKGGIMTIHPIRLFRKLDGQSIMYQTINTILLPEKEDRAEKEKKYQRIGISVVYNKEKKHQTNQRCREKKYDLLGLDNLPSTRRRREYRIRFCFDCEVWKFLDSDPVLVDEVNMRDCVYFLDENKHIDTDRNKLIQFKLFLWPNYRLEDLACMNRYWFYTNNGSRFSMSRIHMYPRFRIS